MKKRTYQDMQEGSVSTEEESRPNKKQRTDDSDLVSFENLSEKEKQNFLKAENYRILRETAEKGDVQLLKHYYAALPYSDGEKALSARDYEVLGMAARGGRLEVVEFLYDSLPANLRLPALQALNYRMSREAGFGENLDILEFCFSKLLDPVEILNAIQSQNYEILDQAVIKGSPEVVKFVYDILPDNKKIQALRLVNWNRALENKNYFTVTLLFAEAATLNEKFTAKAVDIDAMIKSLSEDQKKNLFGTTNKKDIIENIDISKEAIIAKANKRISDFPLRRKYSEDFDFVKEYIGTKNEGTKEKAADTRVVIANISRQFREVKELPKEIADRIVLEAKGCNTEESRNFWANRIRPDGTLDTGPINSYSKIIVLREEAKARATGNAVIEDNANAKTAKLPNKTGSQSQQRIG
ncbi:MAG: hypothetical protein K0R63_1762 [Rickettsiales bacterium]|jgi:hypothetical protein|nr:hypothetical protein [Rickettsiales bacterium]